jgi:4-oxalocrotonate tautomerase
MAQTTVFFHTQGEPMPTIRVDLFEGRTPEQKRNFVKALTQACVETLGSKPESVDVILYDIKPADWATGGELWSEKKTG